MKTTIRVLLLLVLALVLSNCEKESEGLTYITYYAEITLEGGIVTIPLNGTYTEPGYS